MADVFVSYKREDQAAIEPLVHLLETKGFSIWWDPSIVPGERFASVIRDALNNAKCVIVGGLVARSNLSGWRARSGCRPSL
jgi:hypothetical protein